MWAALHDQGQADQRLWDMALQQLHEHRCAACCRHSKPSESNRSLDLGQTTAYAIDHVSA